ncbi:hypothetical protein E4L96_02385 [Massilia arenosa]|uniref:Big-1 domain-containing protein n=1 Tax=Zemynaea arenosa TaxID=2561931 RepID=A0A4Y9ST73_9BURK|nr:hypothetical protein [Massilia arenosa]TFW28424.1 hypothetical protein E4L96_02385 [Massilia arenosa]
MTQISFGKRLTGWIATAACGLLLAACGGGGGNPGSTIGTGGGGTGGTGNSTDPSMTLTLTDASGAAVSSLSGAQTGSLRATLLDGAKKPVANAIVNFKSSDTALVDITPGSALTDATGVAVATIKPKSTTVTGATQISADAVVASKTATASVNMQVGAAPLTVGALSLTPVPGGPLAAFSTVQLNIPVTSGGQPATAVSGLTLSSLCQGDNTATIVAGALANGVQSATYTNNGCLRGTDVITVSIGSSSQTITVPVSPATIGAINFVGSNVTGSSIVLKGSGGLGRSEAAQLTFKVVDSHNTGLPGVDVQFRATTTTGGLTVSPAKATTDANGNVTTIVSSGTIPTPVRVIAEATRNGVTISGLSDALTISTGLPIQKSMSMSSDSYNIEGWGIDGQEAKLTVRMADQYGNPVSDGSTINFVTEGGAVGSSAQGSCTTTDGGCSVSLRSQNFRPANGRVTVLAFAQGIEDFVDSNGDGQFTCTNYRDSTGAVPSVYRPLVDTCVSGGEPSTDLGDAFLDAGKLAQTTGVQLGDTLDGSYDAANGDLPFPYNHTGYSSSGDGKWGINYIRRSVEIVFSGSSATLVRQKCDDTTGVCRDWTAGDGDSTLIDGVAGAGCSDQPLAFRIYDLHNNPLPKGTTLASVDSTKISTGTFFPGTVGSTNAIGGTIHKVNVKADPQCASGAFTLTVTTPGGSTTAFRFHSN